MPDIFRVPVNPQVSVGNPRNIYPNEPLNVPLQYAFNPRLDKGLRPGVNQQWNRADNQS